MTVSNAIAFLESLQLNGHAGTKIHACPTAFKLEEIPYTPPDTQPSEEPRDPHEVPPEDWEDPDTFPENRGPKGPKSHGQKMSCEKGIDYAQTCPIGWKYVPSGPQGPECQAPSTFYTESVWCRQQLTPRQVVPARLDEWSKKELYDACWILWPCRDVKHDYRKPCPQGWTWEQDGTCSAPFFYRGTCPWSVNLLNYTSGMKATFAANCGVGWPLDKRYEGSQPKPLPAKYPSHAPGQKPAWECKRNYMRDCPDGFYFDGAMCHEDGSYIGANMKNCAHFDPRRWTDEMKEAFSGHCHVWWPCNQAPGSSKASALPNGPLAQARLPMPLLLECPEWLPGRYRHEAIRRFL